jgi:predicted RNA-binding protein with PIN domain
MTDKIIIDAWNVCWRIPDIASLIPNNLQLARIKFNQLIKSSFLNKNINYKIIYDGQPDILNNYYDQNESNIHYTKKPETADSYILKFIRKQRDQKRWTVITSDYELVKKVRLYDAQVITAEEFVKKLMPKNTTEKESSKKYNPELNNSEIEFWMQIFNKDR